MDTAGCTGTCGDGTANGPEDCDGSDLQGETCVTQGYGGGTLACDPNCLGFDTSGCYSCGDDMIAGPEQCDGMNLNGEDIASTDLDKYTEPRKSADGSKNKFKTPLKDIERNNHIGLQYHGHPVWYRNITIIANTDPVAVKGVASAVDD